MSFSWISDFLFLVLSLDGATYTVDTKASGGGVGRNIAECIFKIYGDIHFISAVGNDEIGKNLKQLLPSHCTKYVITNPKYSTSMCNVVFDRNGDCKLVLGDMEIHQSITSELILKYVNLFKKCPLIIMDSNLTIDTMGTILEIAAKYNKPVFFEPTDMRIADKPFQLPRNLTKQIKIISPNIYELQAISNRMNSDILNIDLHSMSENREELIKTTKKYLQTIEGEFDCVLVTLGAFGVIVSGTTDDMSQQFFDNNLNYIYQINPNNNFKTFYFTAPTVKNLINVSGAGDSFTGGFISSALQQKSIENCVSTGFYAAGKALQSESAVPKQYFSYNKLDCNESLLKLNGYLI